MAKKKTIKKSGKKKSGIKKGDKYTCSVCGLVISVDTVCNCVDVCDIICCSEQMKPKKK